MEEHEDVANSQGISTPTICCYERKVKLTKLHVGFATVRAVLSVLPIKNL